MSYRSLSQGLNKWTRVFCLLLMTLVVKSVGAQITLRSNPTTATGTASLTINKPLGVVVGDVMIANVANYLQNTQVSASCAGWTVIAGTDTDRGRATLLYKIAGASEPSSYTFTVTTGSTASTGAIVAFSGVNTTTPFDVTPATSWYTQSAASLTAVPSITTNTANAAVIMFGNVSRVTSSLNANFVTSSWSTANLGNLTELYDVGYNNTNNSPALGAAWAIDATPGATGNGSLNCNVNTNPRIMGAMMVALKAAVPAVTVAASTTTPCVGSSINLTSALTGNIESKTLAFQGFETAGNTVTYAGSGGGVQSGFIATGDGPASSGYARGGINGYAVANGTATVTLANVTGLTGYTNKRVYLNLATFSIGSTSNGADALDNVTVAISLNNGGSWSNELQITGASTNNSYWGYNTGSAVASTTYDGDNASTVFSPTGSGNRTTDGYSELMVTIPDNATQVRVRVTMLNNNSNEVWVIDDITIAGTPTPQYSWTSTPTGFTSSVANPSNVSVSANTTYAVSVTDANGLSVSSNVAVTPVSPVTPSVTISSSDADNTFCAGSNITFTATPTNGGPSPSYQWQVNGSNVGTNSAAYSTTGLTNGQIVSVVMTANNACQNAGSATSNSISNTVVSNVTPSVSIVSSDADNSICAGTSVTFTATPTNGGTTPAYQWKLNGTNVGTNSVTYNNAALANGAIVTVVMTANNTCQTANSVTSNAIATSVTANVTPTVAVTSSDANNSICAGTSVTFTATPNNGGTTPAYQWKLNGTNVGTNATTYTNAALVNNDVVTVVLTANNTCQTSSTANGNNITTQVINNVTPSVVVTSSDANNSICAGTSVTFTASPVNGGATPSYQWQLNGTNVGTNASTYSNASLADNDVVTVTMTANNACQTTATAIGNSITTTVLSNVVPAVNIGASTSSTSGQALWNFTATAAVSSNSSGLTISNISVGNSNNPATSYLDNVQPSTGYTGATGGNAVAMAEGGGGLSTANGGSVYFEFTITPQSGYWFALNSIGFGSRSSNGNGGPTAFALRTSVDNYATSVYTGALTANSAWDYISFGINSALANSSSAITYRIYGYNGANNTSSINWRIDDLLLELTSNALTTTTTPSYCNGATPLFIAQPTNGGSNPAYQWKLNGANVGTNSSTYFNPNLVNGDVVSVVMTGNNVCQSPATATSNSVTVAILSSLLSTTGATNCGTGTVTVSATSSCNLPGSSISWFANATGGTALASGSSYTTTASSSTIFYAQENFIGGEINFGNSSSTTNNRGLQFNLNSAILLNSVNMESSANTTVTIQLWDATTNAAMVIGGNTMSANRNLVAGNNLVSLGWNIPVGTGYRLVVTANSAAANLTRTTTYLFPQSLNGVGMITGNVDTGGADRYNYFYNWNYSTTRVATNITINNAVTPSVVITSNDTDNSICAGTSVTFTATPTNGGTTPAYQWKLNGNNVGSNIASYSNSGLSNNDVVTVVMTANNTCQTSATANGNTITTAVIGNVTPSVAISSNDADNSICAGTSVTFTATPTNGGTTPAYQWKLNGNSVGSNIATYSNSALSNNDVVTVVMTANNTCQTISSVNANSISTAVLSNANYYLDEDGDTYGETSTLVTTCIQPAGYTTEPGDCDDENSDAYPFNLEVCNASDDDCDGVTDNGISTFTFYADLDEDGYGSNTASIVSCDYVAGYIMSNGDCNDANASVNPLALELCSTSYDDDCDGWVNESCNLTNDDPLFSNLIIPSTSLVNCNTVTGNLGGASPSTQVGIETLTGNNPDVWFYFTASSPGVTIRCIPNNDVKLELRTGAGALLKSSDAVAGVGDEYLNFGELTTGGQYYVRIIQQDSPSLGGAFSLCTRRITSSGNLNYTNSILYDSGCDIVYASSITGSTTCSIQLTPIAPTGGAVISATGSSIPLANFTGTGGEKFQYNTTYQALITLGFTLPTGNGGTEIIQVSRVSDNNLVVQQHQELDLGSVHSCPNRVSIGGIIRANLWLCDAVRYQWKFEKTVNGVLQLVNGNPVVIEVLGPLGTRDFVPTALMGFTAGSEWRVQVRPIFANNVVGSYGTNYQCMKFKGTAAAMPTVQEDEASEKSLAEDEALDLVLYPNPSGRASVRLSWSKQDDLESEVVVRDMQGRVITRIENIQGNLIELNGSSLSGGMYSVEWKSGTQTQRLRWLVQ